MAPRATWSGTISFGLVSIPIKLYTASDDRGGVSFREINQKTGNRVGRKKVDAVTGDEVPNEAIVKGYEVSKDQYVLIDPSELDELRPDKSSAVEILAFVDPELIDPLYIDKPYYVGSEAGGEKPYALLMHALQKSNRVAVGRLVMRQKQYLCMVRPHENMLNISLLRWATQIRDAAGIDAPDVNVTDQELEMATALIDSMTEYQLDLDEYQDEYSEQLLELIEARIEDREFVIEPETAQPEAGKDLFEVLQASLQQAQEKERATG